MKKIYKVFSSIDKEGNKFYYAAHYQRSYCPIWGSISNEKSVATRACADRLCLSVKEYNSLQAM